jgi:hypothetical protein
VLFHPNLGALPQGPVIEIPKSAESASQSTCAEVNRAFSASVSDSVNPGAEPQAQRNDAPLALSVRDCAPSSLLQVVLKLSGDGYHRVSETRLRELAHDSGFERVPGAKALTSEVKTISLTFL